MDVIEVSNEGCPIGPRGPLAEFVHPGEQFYTNMRLDGRRLPGETPIRAEERVAQLEASGDFQSVRIVPQAFDYLGRPIEGYVAIVVRPK